MTKRRGFTLIESLAVIAIIGILATLATTIALGAQRSSRDAKRKNDLYAISQGFDARALDRTCNDPNVIGQYPQATLAGSKWVTTASLLGTINNPCAPFSEYMKTIPEDPQPTVAQYYYNLSGSPQLYRHYRLATSLERSNISLDECQQASAIWEGLQGQEYDCATNNGNGNTIPGERGYQYYIGK